MPPKYKEILFFYAYNECQFLDHTTITNYMNRLGKKRTKVLHGKTIGNAQSLGFQNWERLITQLSKVNTPVIKFMF